MFIGHTISPKSPDHLRLHSRQNSELIGYRTNDGIEVELLEGDFTQDSLLKYIEEQREVQSLYLKAFIIDPKTSSKPAENNLLEKYAVFEKRLMGLIQFFTVHEFKNPKEPNTTPYLERELNKQLATWDIDVGSFLIQSAGFSELWSTLCHVRCSSSSK